MNDSKNYKKTQGQILVELREGAGLSQEQLAEQIDCSAQTISNYENDRYSIPVDKALKFAKLFKVPLDYVLGEIEDKNAYSDAVMDAISNMQRYADAIDCLVEYLAVSSNVGQLTKKEIKALKSEIEWYGRARLERMVNERERGNGKEKQQS